MASRLQQTMRGGLLIPDSRMIDKSFLAPNSPGVNESQYTEAGPKPGSAVTTDSASRLRPFVTGGQGVNLDVRSSRGGNPGRDGCELIWRPDGETSADWRGWRRPSQLNGWAAVIYTDSITYDRTDVVVVPSTQTAVVAFASSTAVTGTRTWSYTPPAAWSSTVAPTFTRTQVNGGAVALVIIPETERILLISWDVPAVFGDASLDVSKSDDAGATWAGYARGNTYASSQNPLGSGGEPSRMRSAFQLATGNIILVLELDDSSGDLAQLASNNLANSFTTVEDSTDLAAFGRHISVFSIPGTNRIGIVYEAIGDNLPYFLSIGSAYEKISEQTPIKISDTTVADLCAWPEQDGAIVVVGRRESAGFEDIMPPWISTDLGATWAQHGNIMANGEDDVTHPTNFAGVNVSGQGLLIHNWVASPGNEDGSVGSMWLGGWHSLTVGRPGAPIQPILSFGDPTGTDRGRVWIPIELPEDHADFTRAGTAPTLTAGAMNITTSSANSRNTHDPWTTDTDEAIGLFELQRVSGPSSMDVVEIRIADGVNDWEVHLRVTTTGLSVFDVNAASAVGTDAVVDLSDPLMIAWNLEQTSPDATFSLWYWRLGETKATAGPTGTLTNDTGGPDANSRIVFGHTGTFTAETNWRMFAWRTHAGTSQEGQFWRQAGTSSEGKAINALSYPLPEIGTTAAHAFLAAQAGPAKIDEAWNIDTEHDHPIENCLPGLHPSREKFWRSTGTTETRITFKLASNAIGATRLGGGYSIGLGLLNCRGFRTALLRGFTTSGGWVTLGTLNLRLPSDGNIFLFDKIGDILTIDTAPPSGFIDGQRYWRHGEFADGGYLWTDGGSETFEILHHNGGFWSKNPTSHPQFRVESSASLSAYEGTVVAHSGVLVVHLPEDALYERYQVQIEAGTSNASPWDYFQIGSLVLGWIAVPGQQPSNGWQKRQVLNTDRTLSRSGERRIKEQGPPVWDWSWSWVDGMLTNRLGSNAEYRGSPSGAPLIQTQDVFHFLAGIARHDLKSGEVPVIGLEEVPDADGTTITAPDLWNYANLSPVIQQTQIQGDDGRPEMFRVESILLEGLP